MNERLVYRLKGIPSDGFVGSYGLYVECDLTTILRCAPAENMDGFVGTKNALTHTHSHHTHPNILKPYRRFVYSLA